MNTTARLLLRTGATIALVDFIFASCLTVFAYGGTFARLWRGVAGVPFGQQALDGPTWWVAIGILCHITTAFTWSAVYLFGVSRLEFVRQLVSTRFGVLKVAAIYGPCIWIVMSFAVIPTFTHRLPAITIRWFIQVAGHVFAVGTPIVWTVSGRRGSP